MEGSKKENKNKKRKASTRLQKHAPPALQVDGITTGVCNVKVDDGELARYAIPLLSPLLLSPHDPVVVDAKGKELPAGKSTAPGGGNEVATLTTEGWKHPAVGVMMEPSKLGAMFQSQCMLVNNA
ncbi:hypothetical protein Pfo_006996 [Paulownia fortunei]|nr:hypothetical protein Pfo_006996 [Paulownia fortunei]